MARPIIIVVVIIAVFAGAMFLLAGRAGERPQTRVEKVVSLGDLKK